MKKEKPTRILRKNRHVSRSVSMKPAFSARVEAHLAGRDIDFSKYVRGLLRRAMDQPEAA